VAEFLMPILGSDMTAGTLLAWRKQPGDTVRRGDVIAEVETDKADIEVESFQSGVLEQILVQPGEKVPVGTSLAILREEGAPASAPTAPAAPLPMTAPPAPAPAPSPPAAPPPRAAGPARVTPVARKLAADLGVDLATVVGSGPGGRIQERDVREAAAARVTPPPTPLPAVAAPADRQARMRQAIAAAMVRSSREIPHFHLATTIDMSQALSWLADENARRGVADRLLYGVLLLKAVARAVRAVPELNGVWGDGAVVPNPDVHVGVAISLRGGGLVAPALHQTDALSLDELMRQFRDLVQRARAGSLRSSELSDPTITVTSLGDQGVEQVFGLIYPPQVALVGFGKVVERPWVVEGQVVPRPVITASLAADHRVVDGHRGSVFLTALDRLLQEPGAL
jgi:pyruvate dehydrogenase E2 component (dihydrolipoamide acetyltransferase)